MSELCSEKSSEGYDVIILGAGISGLVSASITKEQGNDRIIIIDHYDKLGGNHINCNIASYTFDIGTLIFQDDSPLLAHFPELIPAYLPVDPSWAKLTPKGAIASYPLSIKEDILQSGPWGCIRIISSLLYSRLTKLPNGNARNFARYWMGSYLLSHSGLENYMSRFFGISAAEVDFEFAQKRMLWIKQLSSINGLVRHLIERRSPRPTNRQMARPRSGFHGLYAIAADKLHRRGVDFQLGSKLDIIRKVSGGFEVVSGGACYKGRRIISTIPINRVLKACGLPTEELPSVTLISLFYSFSGNRCFNESILYNFSRDGQWKRLSMYSDFYGKSIGREYFSVEVISSPTVSSIEAADQDFRTHVAQNRLFQGDLILEGGLIVPEAYPIYTRQAQQRASQAIDRLHAFGIESFGRQGGFDYQPTARVSTLVAEQKLRRQDNL